MCEIIAKKPQIMPKVSGDLGPVQESTLNNVNVEKKAPTATNSKSDSDCIDCKCRNSNMCGIIERLIETVKSTGGGKVKIEIEITK